MSNVAGKPYLGRDLPKASWRLAAIAALSASIAAFAAGAPALAQVSAQQPQPTAGKIPALASAKFAWLALGVDWLDPPAGLVEVITSPPLSPATHRLAVGHEIRLAKDPLSTAAGDDHCSGVSAHADVAPQPMTESMTAAASRMTRATVTRVPLACIGPMMTKRPGMVPPCDRLPAVVRNFYRIPGVRSTG